MHVARACVGSARQRSAALTDPAALPPKAPPVGGGDGHADTAALARGSAEQKFPSLSLGAFDRGGFCKTIAAYAKIDIKLVVIVNVYAIGSGCGCQYYTLCVPTQRRGSVAAAAAAACMARVMR